MRGFTPTIYPILMKNILIAGGSGFLGKQLSEYLLEKGFQVSILSRNKKDTNAIYWDGKNLGKWTETLNEVDILINLSGKSVDCRYNSKNRKEILDSRIDSTNILQSALDAAPKKQRLWLNASSATIYIHAESQLMSESSGIIGDDFSMNICKKWEAAFFNKSDDNTRKVSLRTSIVLGNTGGAFPKIKHICSIGLGGHQGNGKQMVSWIHIDDFCAAVDYIIKHKEMVGPINITAPKPVRNRHLMKETRSALGWKWGIPQAAVLLEIGALLLGTETELLLKSRNVYPETLLRHGFNFKFPYIKNALQNLI